MISRFFFNSLIPFHSSFVKFSVAFDCFSESSSKGYFVRKSMYVPRTGSLFLGGVSALSGLIISIDSVACLSEQYSRSLNLLQNFLNLL